MRQCLAQLSEPDREVLVMRDVEQLSIKEIAAVLDATEGAIKTRHFRALECCASCWDRCWGISGSTTVTDPSMPGAQFLIGQVYFDSLMVPLDVPDLAPSLRERYTADQLALLPAEANVPFTVAHVDRPGTVDFRHGTAGRHGIGCVRQWLLCTAAERSGGKEWVWARGVADRPDSPSRQTGQARWCLKSEVEPSNYYTHVIRVNR